MYDAVAIGECLIDFAPYGSSENGQALYERNAGGAPANVLAMLSKLGAKTAFIGKVGRDDFGFFLRDVLRSNSIAVEGLAFSEDIPTTLAFVHLKEDGDRSFQFYRQPGADLNLDPDDVPLQFIDRCRLLHFGSVSMTGEPSRSATLKAASYAKQQGKLVTYDPNLREPLWSSLEEAKRVILQAMPFADILKVSEEELRFLAGGLDLAEGTQWLRDQYQVPVIFVTQGKAGCFYRTREHIGQVPGYQVNAVDTTGAGDAFFGAVIARILGDARDIRKLSAAGLEDFVRFGNAAGALTTMKKGAIPALPTREQILDLMS